MLKNASIGGFLNESPDDVIGFFEVGRNRHQQQRAANYETRLFARSNLRRIRQNSKDQTGHVAT